MPGVRVPDIVPVMEPVMERVRGVSVGDGVPVREGTEHDDEPAADVVPNVQGRHRTAPGLAAYVLAGHAEHERALNPEEAVPTGHATHELPLT